MNTYLISDNHFNHWRINFLCNRGFTSLDSMNYHMISSWNSTIKDEDTVIFGGDFAFGPKHKQIEIFEQLNSDYKIIIKGNHDSSTRRLLDIGFKEAVKVYETEEFIVRHRPKDFTEEEKSSNKWLIHGHTHRELLPGPKYLNICVEPLNYIPRTLEQLKKLYADKQEEAKRTL